MRKPTRLHATAESDRKLAGTFNSPMLVTPKEAEKHLKMEVMSNLRSAHDSAKTAAWKWRNFVAKRRAAREQAQSPAALIAKAVASWSPHDGIRSSLTAPKPYEWFQIGRPASRHIQDVFAVKRLDKKKTGQQAIVVLCTDVVFLANVVDGRHVLDSQPTQRPAVIVEDLVVPDSWGAELRLKLGRDTFDLEADNKDEKIRCMKALRNTKGYTPTDSL